MNPDPVGIVVVSHSRALATAAVALAAEMVPGTARIAVAAGLDETTTGTDATRIVEAVGEVDSPGGVVVLMDLGSAVLSAELALELLDDDAVRDRVLLSPAPLVEGLVVAAVAAAAGASREQVAAEAMGALAAKVTALGPPAALLAGNPDPPAAPPAALPAGDPDPPAAPSAAGAQPEEVRGGFEVRLEHGVHARPAARLVGVVATFDADVRLRDATTGGGWVPAGSMTRVAALGAQRGHRVQITASGPQAREAVDALLALADRDFDETAPSEAPGGSPARTGSGPARVLAAEPVPVDDTPAGPPEAELGRLADAVAVVREHVAALRRPGPADAVFGAHLQLLADRELTAAAQQRVRDGASAPRAWADAAGGIETVLAGLPDPYLRARAADLRAVADQVLRVLARRPADEPVDVAGVLVADDLTPAQAAGLDPLRVTGVVLAGGDPTSHAVLLLAALGIPAVVGAGRAVLDVTDGTPLTVDAAAGRWSPSG